MARCFPWKCISQQRPTGGGLFWFRFLVGDESDENVVLGGRVSFVLLLVQIGARNGESRTCMHTWILVSEN